jgi:peptidoglycan hydrolase CwlO-like protein
MAFIDKLKEELDRAGRVAQGALDEGKTRLEAFRTRQLADKAAQALGYAVFRAKQSGGEIDADTYSRLAATLATHDADASRHEQELELKRHESRSSSSAEAAASAAADTAAATAGAAAAAAANATESATDSAAKGASSSSSPYSGTGPTDQGVSG